MAETGHMDQCQQLTTSHCKLDGRKHSHCSEWQGALRKKIGRSLSTPHFVVGFCPGRIPLELKILCDVLQQKQYRR